MSTSLKPLKWYKKLTTKKGRLEAGVFIVEGTRAINQIINNHPDEIIEILTIEEPLPVYSNYVVRLVTENQFRYICQTKTPQGVMAAVRIPVDIWSDCLRSSFHPHVFRTAIIKHERQNHICLCDLYTLWNGLYNG